MTLRYWLCMNNRAHRKVTDINLPILSLENRYSSFSGLTTLDFQGFLNCSFLTCTANVSRHRYKHPDFPSWYRPWANSRRLLIHTSAAALCHNASETERKKLLQSGPGLEYFIANGGAYGMAPKKLLSKRDLDKLSHPYVDVADVNGYGRKVYFDVYGCQMNVNDTEVAWSVLRNNGYERTDKINEADVVLVMTCSVREGAEQKVRRKLDFLRGLKNKRGKKSTMKIGILGCMAERLKKKLVEEEKSIDVVAGPDSYRDLPRLLAIVDDGKFLELLISFLIIQ